LGKRKRQVLEQLTMMQEIHTSFEK